jgi:mono/diheme cytochrome c family protein
VRVERTAKEGWTVAGAEAVLMVALVGLLAVAGVVGYVIGHYTAVNEHGTTTNAATTQPTTTAAGNAAGKAIFVSAGCGGCHTLQAAGSSGNVGPNLDQAQPAKALVLQRVTNGKGAMPSFKGQLSAQQIAQVADFVAGSAGSG